MYTRQARVNQISISEQYLTRDIGLREKELQHLHGVRLMATELSNRRGSCPSQGTAYDEALEWFEILAKITNYRL